MARRLKITGFCFVLLLGVTEQALSDNITKVHLSVKRPAHLSLGERVNVSFQYATDHTGGVRLFVRPMTKNATSPNYSAHGSKIYSAREGMASGHFTISKGNVMVDRIRININAANGQLLFTKYIPVKLLFSNKPITTKPGLRVRKQPKLELQKFAGQDGGQSDRQTSDQKVTRTILPDGSVEIRYPDGRRKILYEGGHKIIYPDGREQVYSYMSVQPAIPPILPQQQSILDWLDGMNNRLLNTIRMLVDGNQQAIDYYIQKENQKTQNLYEKMLLRTAYIDRLVTN